MTTGIVEALYPYSYEAGDGRTIAFAAGDRFSLLSKTNNDWWHVRRGTEKPMYVPATYMQEIFERRGNVIYENVHIGESGGIGLNLSAATSEESGRSSQDSLDSSSKEEESESFLGLENGADQETKNEEDKISDVTGTTGDSWSDVKGVSSGVKSLAKSLELSGACLRGGSFSMPSRPAERPKSQSLPVGWALVTDEDTGRPYYFNSKTNETSWKPPRISRAMTPSPTSQCPIPPFGWRLSTASCTDEPLYVNEYTNEKWLSSKDDTGRVYYYQVNGAATSWELPEVDPASRQSFEALDVTYRRRSPNLSLRNSKCQSMLTSIPRNSHTNTAVNLTSTADDFSVTLSHERTGSVQSRDSVSSSGGEEFAWPEPPTPTTTLAVNFFQEIEKQGLLNRKKVIEGGGRKVKRVSWTTSFVILFSSNMVFYKDQKAAQQKPGLPHGKPESSCVLQGASLEWASPSSTKKKNAFEIQTVSGLVFLLQHDHQMEASNWFNAIASVIRRLKEDESSTPATVQYPPPQGPSSAALYDSDDALDEPGVPNSLVPGVTSTGMRTRRSGSEREESKNRIKDRLRKLISRRPPMEELEKKGILKESVFGCHIAKLCEKEKESVPLFVTNCITAIEKRGLSFDGLYRVCGNVSTVQKIRIMVDQEEKITLGEPPFDDVHALTGTLKLYFRELPEPLIPFDFFSGFVVAIKQSTRKDKLKAMRSLVTQMPKVNCDTLKSLLRHLQKLMEQSEENRMTAQNLAIVWGPNLMWPRHDAGDIAVNMVHQNQIIEFLLLEFEQVFK